MRPVHRRDVLAALSGLSSLARGGALNGARAEPAKKSPGKSLAKPTPPFRPKLIALDPGHGGRDPGALGVRGTQEKGVVWTIAGELKQQLMAGGRYRVMLTRAGDSYVALRERVARAQALKADLFLSIHADSHPDPGARGASVYTLSEEATDREAAALAARENRADKVVSGVPLASQSDTVVAALVAMSQRGTLNDSCRLADPIGSTFGQHGVRPLPPTPRQAGLSVAHTPGVPAALVELGYLSHVQDGKLF